MCWTSGASGILCHNYVSNTEARSRTVQPPLTEIIQQRRLAMLGHISRMPPPADVRRTVLRDIPSECRRPLLRPRKTWLAIVRGDLHQCGITMDDVPDLAGDRALWRRMTRGATHHCGAHSWRKKSSTTLVSWPPCHDSSFHIYKIFACTVSHIHTCEMQSFCCRCLAQQMAICWLTRLLMKIRILSMLLLQTSKSLKRLSMILCYCGG